jgi:secondary thiamine-phosphate synthase enzyme
MIHQSELSFSTPGRGTLDITREVEAAVAASGASQGVALLFVRHTSASLIVCENADPTVRRDLEAWLARAVPDGDRLFRHTAEGPDDMPAHVRATLTATSLSVPLVDGRLHLGTWQGLYLYEHRTAPHQRRVHLTITGA